MVGGATLMRLVSVCWRKPKGGGSSVSGELDGDGFERDGLLRYLDLGRCSSGDFSMAVVQANQVLEDQSRIDSAPFGTFVGVFDGHGGHDASRYACDRLYHNLTVACEQGVTSEAIERAFLQTEEGFISVVSELWDTRPGIATVGSCCLVGVISQRTLYVANLGDSRAVLGKKVGNTGQIAAIPLCTEHNASIEAVRQELKSQHPNDPQIVALKHGVWRVKGIIQVSRSIGDAYLKHAQYNREPIDPKYRISGPMEMPILSAKPSITSHDIHQNDSFLIFASDGLWEHLSNDTAVEIVHKHPRARRPHLSKPSYLVHSNEDEGLKSGSSGYEIQQRTPQKDQEGSARRLVKAALQEAARKREMRYSDLCKIDKKVRRHFHDDITVTVLFLNHELGSKGASPGPPMSVRSALDH